MYILENADNLVSDESRELVYSDSDEDNETNNDRLLMVTNLVNQNDTQNIFGKESDHSSNSDDVIDDEKNAKSIIDKYSNILKNNDSDNDSSSDNNNDDKSEND